MGEQKVEFRLISGEFEFFQVFTQFAGGGDFFRIVPIRKCFLPDELTEGLGNFAGVGFGG